jgi:hypothetical protein
MMTDFAAACLPPSSPNLVTRLRTALARRRAERDLRIGAARLAALSAHLACDIGLEPMALPDPEVPGIGRA